MKRNKGGPKHGQCDDACRAGYICSNRMRSPLHLCMYHLAISPYDASVDRPPTLVLTVGGVTRSASKQELFSTANDRTKKRRCVHLSCERVVEITVLSCNAGMSTMAKAEREAPQNEQMIVVMHRYQGSI